MDDLTTEDSISSVVKCLLSWLLSGLVLCLRYLRWVLGQLL